jgi:low temperature requirement protein LtrA
MHGGTDHAEDFNSAESSVALVSTADAERQTGIERATTMELFLDLVFVFTITQLTELVSHPHDLAPYGKAALLVCITWWMYGGYIWLTGNLRLDRQGPRLAIFAGMAGFLLMALATPGAFGATAAAPSDTGIIFGVAFLGVTLIHFFMFTTVPNSSANAIWRIAPFNITGAALVLLGGFVDDDWRWTLWLAAVLVLPSSTLFGRSGGWAVNAGHFVERHGLVVIVAFGESIVAIGVGAGGLELDAGLVATALLALMLSAAMWWLYFDHDDTDSVAALAATSGDRRGSLGMAMAYTHVVMLAGIVLMSAGVKSLVAHPDEPVETASAWNLAAGVALYIVGEVAFRYSFGLGATRLRLAAAGVVLLTVPIGLEGSGLAQLAAALVVVMALIVTEKVRPYGDVVTTG